MANHPYARRGKLKSPLQGTYTHGHAPEGNRSMEYERHESPAPEWKVCEERSAAAKPINAKRRRRWPVLEWPDAGNEGA
jgi:hypothetical protein